MSIIQSNVSQKRSVQINPTLCITMPKKLFSNYEQHFIFMGMQIMIVTNKNEIISLSTGSLQSI